MRSIRPSGKAVLAAGAIAVTLVVVATSGAVAGALITSDDIQDNTVKSRDIKDGTIRTKDIRAGAVTWESSLSQATKDLIEGLAQSGAAGPPGAQGPAGPAGPAGAAGSNGAPGAPGADGDDAELVAWNTFGGEGAPSPLISGPLGELLPIGYVQLAGDHEVVIDEPGTYLVSMRSATDVTELAESLEMDISALLSLFGIISPTKPIQVDSRQFGEGTEEDPITASEVSATVDTEALSRSCLSIVVCNTSYAVTVEDGETLDLSSLYLLTLGGSMCDETGCTTPVKVNVGVTRLAGDPADFITVDPYTVSFCQVVDSGPVAGPCASEKQIRPRQLKGFIQDLVPSA